jgi:hypothetical protein
MGMTERDRKVLAVVLALVVLGGFWFLVIGKKRKAITAAQTTQAAAQQELGQAQAAEAASKNVVKVKPVAYSRLLRLGKAIPDDDDFQSLLVQISDLSDDEKVQFVSLTSSDATDTATSTGPTGQTSCEAGASDVAGASGATGAAPAPSTAATGASGATGSTAQTWIGRDRDKAKNAAAEASQAAEKAATACAESPTLTDLTATAAGLTKIIYSFNFKGSFFNLHNVVDGVLGFVKVHNGKVTANGRLLDISTMNFSVETFPSLNATINMTGYKLPDEAASTAAAAAAAAATVTAGTPATAPTS